MIFGIEDKMPHVEVFTNGKASKQNIQNAYKDLSTAYQGIRDYVSILDGYLMGKTHWKRQSISE